MFLKQAGGRWAQKRKRGFGSEICNDKGPSAECSPAKLQKREEGSTTLVLVVVLFDSASQPTAARSIL